VQLPTARSSFITGHANYEANRQRLGGHSETYEVSRMVVRNRIIGQLGREFYKIRVRFPEEYNLTNAVFTPGATPFGEITPQVTPVLVNQVVDHASDRSMSGVELDIAFRITLVEEEPRRAAIAPQQNPAAALLQKAMNGMDFRTE